MRRHKLPVQDVRNFFHGTVVDLAMREWLLSDELTPDAMVGLIETIANEQEAKTKAKGKGVVKWRNPTDRERLLAYCRRLVTRLEPILRELVLPYEFEPAHRFKVPLTIEYLDGSPTQITLIGEMDILTRNKDGLFSIWDLKATENDNYWRKTWPQLVFYEISVMAGFGTECDRTGLIQPMCKEPVLEFDITEEDRMVLLSKIEKMAHAMWRNDMEPKKDDVGCSYCIVRHNCIKWTPRRDPETGKLKIWGVD